MLNQKARATLAQLNERMEARGEFPAFASAVSRVTEALNNENQNAAELTQAVLSDFALTQKVLRLANSAMYRTIGGEVTTVSRAIMMLGVQTVGNLAVSLKLLNAFADITADNELARQCLARSMLAGAMARNIVNHAGIRDGEEIVVSALMHSLGELLVSFYLPEMWQAVLDAEDEGNEAPEAQRQVLGLTVHELASEVMRLWHMPDRLVQSIEPCPMPTEGMALDHRQWLSTMAQFSHELASAAEGGVVPPLRLESLSNKYCQLLALKPESVIAGLEALENDEKERRLVVEMLDEAGEKSDVRRKPADATRRLRNALQEEQPATTPATLQFHLASTVESIYTSLGAQRAVLFARNGHRRLYQSRLVFGETTRKSQVEGLEFPEAFAPDLFHLAMTNGGQPIWVETANLDHISRRMPKWYHARFNDAASFLIVPVTVGKVCPLLLYVDWSDSTQLSEDEITLTVRLTQRLGTSLAEAMKTPMAA